MNLLEKLGFRITKPTVKVKVKPEVSEETKRINKQRKDLYEKDARETSSLYNDWIPDEVFNHLCSMHDYKCVMWGSRKFGRLMNISRNIMDMEIYRESPTLEESDRENATRLLMWMSLLFPIPIKVYHLSHTAEMDCKKELISLLSQDSTNLSFAEVSIIIEAVFEGVSTKEGNPLLDIFHDALRFEEAQFGSKADLSIMRTELGKNTVFSVKAQRDSQANRCPDWVVYLQDLKSVNNFVNPIKAKEDEEKAETDGISM